MWQVRPAFERCSLWKEFSAQHVKGDRDLESNVLPGNRPLHTVLYTDGIFWAHLRTLETKPTRSIYL